ncbi:MAG TPA: class F sortase [Chloroflexia bacterium]|nr:class F sortase [Chloroflexia bacterium]
MPLPSRQRLILVLLLGGLLLVAVAVGLFLSFNAGKAPSGQAAEIAATPLTKGGLNLLTPGESAQAYPTGPTEPTPLPVTPALPAVAAPPLSPAATATYTPPPLPVSQAIIPYKIRIPAIGIDTYVERVGVLKDGTMDVPKNIWNTAWFGNGGYMPGSPGNAVIAGHLDAPGSKAVFWDLDKLKAGDRIFLSDQAGKELVFQVAELQVYPVNNAPLNTIFGPSSESRLNLITCSGVFNRAARLYDKRLIVFSKLVANN